jgi:hypothetical protein
MLYIYKYIFKPVTVAARSKAWNVFARLNTGIMGSNPARGMNVCLRLFCVCVLSCVGSGLPMGWSLVQGVLPTVYKCKIKEPHKEEAKARNGLQRHWRRRRRRRYRYLKKQCNDKMDALKLRNFGLP